MAPRETARAAGRGLLWITSAKLYFILAGYTVQLALPRLFGSAATFGLYSTAMSQAAIVNNVLIAATLQTVSKHVSEDAEHAAARLRQGLRVQLVLGLVLCGLVLALAPLIAELILDDAIEPLLRIASAVVFCYALYAALIGSLNGRQLFRRQAQLDMLFTTLRTIGILGCAAAGLGVVGAMMGFAGAAMVLLVVSLALVGTGTRGHSHVPWKRWLGFMAPLWVYQGFLNGALQIDLSVLKRTVAELAIAQGALADIARHQASSYVGYYKAAQTFAFVPYQLVLSVTFVVFPMVSMAIQGGEHEQARTYIRAAMRFSLLVLVAVAAPIAGAARGVMLLAYQPDYVVGAPALTVLIIGIVMFALFVVAATVLSGSGSPRTAATIAGTSLLVVMLAVHSLVRWVGVGEHTLVAAACGTSAGTAFALAASGVSVFGRFGTFIPILSVLRALCAGALAYASAHFLPHESKLQTLVALAAGAAVYGAALVVTRELGRQDLQAVVTLVRRDSRPPGR